MKDIAERSPEGIHVLKSGDHSVGRVFCHCFARLYKRVNVKQHSIDFVQSAEQLRNKGEVVGLADLQDVRYFSCVLVLKEVSTGQHVCLVLNKMSAFDKTSGELKQAERRDKGVVCMNLFLNGTQS